MGSLFTKIFVSFWLAGVLLVASFIGLERHYGGEYAEAASQRLAARAATAAALWEAGGRSAVGRWLRRLGMDEGPPPLLFDNHGQSLLRQPVPPELVHWLPGHIHEGVQRFGPRHYLLVQALPGVQPTLYLVRPLERGHIHILPAWLRLAVTVLITGMVSFGLAFLLTRRLRRLRSAAQALAAGDLSVRVGRRGGDEVEALARDFDAMADYLRELLESQRRLLRYISHELRSPLARLRVALELAERSGDYPKAMTRIGKEADELERLIADVLTISRLESGQAQLQRSPVKLEEVLRQVVTDAEFEAAAVGRHVQLMAETPALVDGHPVLLRSAVENVVRNAVRHTAADSTVEVRMKRQGDHVQVNVRDHGPGVPEAELGRIFEPFARIDEARERASGGYGLGLAITGRAVAAHGGEVRARNHPQGGLEVTISLPAANGTGHTTTEA